jgi:DNA-binding response OmpR family regulator
VTIRVSAQQVWVAENPITLTPKEYALLLCLVRNKGMVLSREQLLVKCWGYDYDGDSRAVDTHIRRLREKLGTAAACVKTVIKSGYKWEV